MNMEQDSASDLPYPVDVTDLDAYKAYPYDVKEVHLNHVISLRAKEEQEISPEDIQDEIHVAVKMTLKMKPKEGISTETPIVLVKGKYPIIHGVTVNGQNIEYQETESVIIIPGIEGEFDVTIDLELFPERNTDLEGMFVTAESGSIVSQNEVFGFRNFGPFPDRPDVMPKVWQTTITAPKDQFPVMQASGHRIEYREDEEAKTHTGTFRLEGTGMPSYLYAEAIGNFTLAKSVDFLTMNEKSVPVEIWVCPGKEDQAEFILQGIIGALEWDEQVFGLEYPYETYRVMVIDDFNFGAMENTGLNIFKSTRALATSATATDDRKTDVVVVGAHECFHTHSGNKVTLRTWHEIALKEGLTTFREQLFEEDLIGRDISRVRRVRSERAAIFGMQSGPNDHPILPRKYDVELADQQLYDILTYNKAGQLLNMLKILLGKERLMAGLKWYFKKHDGQAVSVHDLITAIEEGANNGYMETNEQLDLSQFRNWYDVQGTTTCSVETKFNDDGSCELTVTQSGHSPSEKVLNIAMGIGFIDPDGKEIKLELASPDPSQFALGRGVLNLTEKTQTFRFKNVPKGSVPSLFRDWTAPVKVDYAYTDANLSQLMGYDSDVVNRYDASFRMLKNATHELIKDPDGELSEDFIAAYRRLLDEAQIQGQDPERLAVLAEMLAVPSLQNIVQDMEVYDFQSAQKARDLLINKLAVLFEEAWLTIYYSNLDNPEVNKAEAEGKLDVDAMQRRQIKNLALKFLAVSPEHNDIVLNQLQNPEGNLTNELNAFTLRLDGLGESPNERVEVIEAFRLKWAHENLVLRDWLGVQCRMSHSDVVDHLNRLVESEHFSVSDTIQLAEFVMSFTANGERYHTREGYELMGKVLAASNNSGLAPRMLARAVADIQKISPELRTEMTKMLNYLKENSRVSAVKAKVDKVLQDIVS